MNRTTETLFLRLDPPLARTVRDRAKARDTTISALAEEALKGYINDTTSADHRAKLLQVTEEALLTRVEDSRLLSNVQGLYAKEAMDTAQTLELVKQVLALGLRDERQLTNIINGSRQEAHKRISARSPWPAPIPPEVEAKIATLEHEKAHPASHIKQQKQQIAALEGQDETYRAGQEELRATLSQTKNEVTSAKRETVKTLGHYSHKGGEAARGLSKLKSHLKYLEFGKVHENEPRGFTRESDEYSRSDFYTKVEAQPQWGVIAHKLVFSLSQDERDRLSIDLKQMVRDIMSAWEAKLGQALNWIGFYHEDKGHPHVHVVVGGYPAAANRSASTSGICTGCERPLSGARNL